jgi:predicted RNA binding protein YcfA (HicA-like mRNA interferase family)
LVQQRDAADEAGASDGASQLIRRVRRTLLEGLGFAEVRQRGSHEQYRHADDRGTTVPFDAGRDISPTLLRKIAKDIGLTAEQLLGRA